MTSNISLELSLLFKEKLQSDLLHCFMSDFPAAMVESHVQEHCPDSRDRVYTPANTLLIMLLSSVQEDESLQQGVSLFKEVFERRGRELQQAERLRLAAARESVLQNPVRAGRPNSYKSKIAKSKTNELSVSTAAYSNARNHLSVDFIEKVFIPLAV